MAGDCWQALERCYDAVVVAFGGAAAASSCWGRDRVDANEGGCAVAVGEAVGKAGEARSLSYPSYLFYFWGAGYGSRGETPHGLEDETGYALSLQGEQEREMLRAA